VDWGYEKFWPEEKKGRQRHRVKSFFSSIQTRVWGGKVSHIFPPFSLSPTCRYASEMSGFRLTPLFAHWGCRRLLIRSACLGNVRPNKNEDGRQRVPTSNFLHCRKYDGMVRRAVEIRSLIFFLFSLSCRVKAGQIIIDSGQISFTSSCLLICSDWWPGLCFRLTSHPFSPSRSSRTHTRQDWRGNCCCCCCC